MNAYLRLPIYNTYADESDVALDGSAWVGADYSYDALS